MASGTSARLIAEYGGQEAYKFTDAVQVITATTLSSTFDRVVRYEPWRNADASELLKHHPIAIWKEIRMHLAPRGGIYGRMCTFYGGWAAAGVPTPTTVQDMIKLHGAVNVTYGGTGDPGTIKVSIPCPFNNTMKDILKGTVSEDAARPVFFYCFTEIAVVDKLSNADRFMITFEGEYTLHGRY